MSESRYVFLQFISFTDHYLLIYIPSQDAEYCVIDTKTEYHLHYPKIE